MTEATARRDGSEWVINGRKRWPGNAVWCDVIVAVGDTADGQVKAFVVEKDNPGYAASKIEGKVSLRMTQNADIYLTNCRVSETVRLQNCNSFADVTKVLKSTRNTVAWDRPDMGSPPTTSPSTTPSGGPSPARHAGRGRPTGSGRPSAVAVDRSGVTATSIVPANVTRADVPFTRRPCRVEWLPCGAGLITLARSSGSPLRR